MKTTIVKIAAAVLCLFLVSSASAQNVLGSLSGRVTDASGKPITGAVVSVTMDETGQKRFAESSGTGEFKVAGLPPGSCHLEVTKPGMGASVQTLEVLVDDKRHLDIALTQGRAEKVTVTAPVSPLKAESGAISTVLENRVITGIPLDGRNFYELSLLLPGVFPSAQGSAGSVRGDFAINVNGAREDSNNFTLDGVYNNDPKLNGAGSQPSVEAIREFEVLTSSYDASFGRNGGGQINVVTRSGSNQLHGTAYEFFRNSKLDATNYFAPADQGKPKDNRNQFGTAIGGPIHRDRTFFFADIESDQTRQGITQVTNVPTQLERAGNFSQSFAKPINPFTGTPFAGNIIPSFFENPIGVAIAALYPLPNRNVPGQNYVSSPTQRDNNTRFDGRVDQLIGSSSALSVRYSFGNRNLTVPFASSTDALVPGYGNVIPRRSQNASLNFTHTFSPTLLSETRLGYNRVANAVTQQNAGTSIDKRLGIRDVSSNARDFGLSEITVTGESVLGNDLTSPQHGVTNNYQVVQVVTIVNGRSTLKIGGDYRALQQNAFRDVESRGFLQFLGAVSQSPLGDLLLGLPTVSGAATLDNPQHLRTHSVDWFAQENFRMRPNLMLNIGLRYEYNSPAVDAQNRARLYDPTTGQLTQVGTGSLPAAGYLPDRNNFAPRVGLAWSPRNSSWVVRAGYGVYYDQASLAPGEGLFFSPPYFNSSIYYSYPGLYTLTLADPFPKNFPLPTAPTVIAYQRNLRTPYVQQWNVAIQRQLSRSLIAEVGYVGSKGTKLLSGRDINQAHPSTTFGSPRPLPQFADIDIEESRANSNYNSLQARLQQRLKHGVSAMASYTFSKSIDDASGFFATTGDSNFPQNSYNLKAERGRSDFDARHRLAVSYTCDLPQGQNIFLKGWQTAGIWTFQSGRPFTVDLLSGTDNANSGIDTLGFGANGRPNRLASGVLSNPGPNEWFDVTAFKTATYGTFGNSGRNILDGPGLASFNVSVLKNTSIKEYGTLQFRAEVFNLLNRTNFDLPDNFVGSPTFGRISSAGDPRRLQFGLKWLF